MLRFVMTLMLMGAAGCSSAAGAGDPPLAKGEVAMSVTETGFEPANLKVKRGEPVRLVITRKTDATCAKEIVVDEYGVKEALPLNKPVHVTFTPTKSGTLRYGCAMDKMVGGVITVQ